MFRFYKKNNGFILIPFLIVLPTFLIFLFSTLMFWRIIQFKKERDHLCRTSSLQMNRQLAHSINDLLKMNPRAKSLRTQRHAAEKAFKVAKASKNPQAIALAFSFLQLTQSLQAQHRALQNQIQLKYQQQRNSSRQSLQRAFHKIKTDAQIIDPFSSLPMTTEGVETDSPTYRVNSLKIKNPLRVYWSSSAPHELQFIYKQLQIKNHKINGSCGSDIVKRRQKWTAELHAAKLS